MTAPTYFSIVPSTQTGSVYSTNFTFVANIPNNFSFLVWDFGNANTIYNSLTAKNVYNYPGTYSIQLSALYPSGGSIVDSATITVDYVLRDAIQVVQEPTNYGVASVTPTNSATEAFVLELTSAAINSEISLVLQSINSNSIPHYAVSDSKWNFLIPQWKFIDAYTNTTVEDQLKIKTTPILDSNGTTVAVSGRAIFYYYDDSSSILNPCPLLLVATLCAEQFSYSLDSNVYQYPAYANSEVTKASIGWQINETIPTNLRITENFVNEIYPIKWSNISIPILITCEYNSFLLNPTDFSLSGVKVLSYPLTNEIGKLNRVNIVLLSGALLDQEVPESFYNIEVDGTTYTPSTAPLYFQASDDLDTPSRGFIFATVTPLVSFDGPVCLSASTVAVNGVGEFTFPKGVPIHPHAYISHPQASVINKIGIVTYSKTQCETIQYYQNLGTVTSSTLDIINAPTATVFDLSNYTFNGTTAVYGMAFDPVLNRLYATDADQDTILMYDNPGSSATPTAVYNLGFYTGDNYHTPAYISIDSDHNFWITLYGGLSCLKFNSSFGLLKVVVPSVSFPIETLIEGSPLVAPPIVETDFNNDVWVCYAHPSNSLLVKFDSNGNELFQCPELNLSSVPVSLAIDSDNNVWVACRETNQVECYHSNTGVRLHSLSYFQKPSYLAFDRNGNLWVTHGLNRISKVPDQHIFYETWEIDSTGINLAPISNTYTTSQLSSLLGSNEKWSGLSVDVFDNVWCINSSTNTIHVFKATDPNTTQVTFNAVPTNNNLQVILSNAQQTISSPNPVPSAQAAGDWTGNRWYQKYASQKFINTIATGKSAPFQVLDLENGIPKIVKINEEFDTAKYFKDLALPEILNKNDIFFDEFMKALVGDGYPFDESVGRVVYERIANFILAHGNLDTVEISQLISMAKQTAVEVDEFATEFPAELERLLNLFSINKHYLRGQKEYDSSLENIVGDMLTTTSLITTGQTLLMKDKLTNTYQPVYVAPLTGALSALTVYPLFLIQIDSARIPLFDNYFFFEYNVIELGYTNNIIEWNSPYNTLSYNLSTYDEWYGDDQLVELSINNLLTKELLT